MGIVRKVITGTRHVQRIDSSFEIKTEAVEIDLLLGKVVKGVGSEIASGLEVEIQESGMIIGQVFCR